MIFSQQFPITALREIKILQALRHKNVVDLIEVVRSKPDNLNKYVHIVLLTINKFLTFVNFVQFCTLVQIRQLTYVCYIKNVGISEIC